VMAAALVLLFALAPGFVVQLHSTVQQGTSCLSPPKASRAPSAIMKKTTWSIGHSRKKAKKPKVKEPSRPSAAGFGAPPPPPPPNAKKNMAEKRINALQSVLDTTIDKSKAKPPQKVTMGDFDQLRASVPPAPDAAPEAAAPEVAAAQSDAEPEPVVSDDEAEMIAQKQAEKLAEWRAYTVAAMKAAEDIESHRSGGDSDVEDAAVVSADDAALDTAVAGSTAADGSAGSAMDDVSDAQSPPPWTTPPAIRIGGHWSDDKY